MSVWTEVTGCVYIKSDSGFSIKKYILDNFQEAKPNLTQYTQHHRIRVDLNFSFSDGNLSAAKSIQDFVDAIKVADKNAIVDIEIQLRFVA